MFFNGRGSVLLLKQYSGARVDVALYPEVSSHPKPLPLRVAVWFFNVNVQRRSYTLNSNVSVRSTALNGPLVSNSILGIRLFFFCFWIPVRSLIHFNVPRSVSPSQNSQLRLLNTLPLTLHCPEVYNLLPLGVSVWPENDVHVRMSHPSSCREFRNSIPPILPYYSEKKMSRLYSTRSDLNDVRTGEVTIKKTSQMSINPKIMNKKP